MQIGYARVSTDDQSLNLQLDALRPRCRKIYSDKLSGKNRKRPGLEKAMKTLRPGDTLIVWRLDRLGRSLSDLIDIVSFLQAKGCEFQSVTESIDTTSASGKLVFHILAALAEFERRLIAERTRAGLASARARGVKLGRKPKLSPSKLREARKLVSNGTSVEKAAKRFRVSRSTLYHHLAVGFPPPSD
jgi:DNA invertase Pin-like site-specific DNA recombinase